MGKPTFTKTNLVHPNSKEPIYKKNGVNTYWIGNNKKSQALLASKVQKPNGTVVTLKNYKKSKATPGPVAPGYTKVNLKYAYSNVYKKNNGTYHFSATGKNKSFFPLENSNSLIKPNGTYTTLKNYLKGKGPATAGTTIGSNIYVKGSKYTKLNIKHLGQNVYKKHGVESYYYKTATGALKGLYVSSTVTKNGKNMTIKDYKKSKTTAGPSTAGPSTAGPSVTVPVPITISKPIAAHTVKASKFTKIAQLLKVIAQRKKAVLNKKPVVNARLAFCANKNKGFGYINRANTMKFNYAGCHGMGGEYHPWKDNLAKVQFVTITNSFTINYNQYQFAKQLEYLYYPPPKNFSGVTMNQIIDMEWFQAQNKFARSLGPRDVFLMYGYSHNGDSWAHAYLDGRFSMSQFKAGVTNASTQGDYFAFFFQARDVYKVNTGDVLKDYNEVLKRIREEKDENIIKSISQMFIDELNALIQRAPATKKAFTVFRGVKDDTYMTGVQDKQYVLNRFCSTSIRGEKAYEFAKPVVGSYHTVQRILLMPGSKCLMMFGFTKYSNEFEILLPRGTAYIIRKVQTDVAHANNRNMCKLNALSTYNKIGKMPDIICLGMTKKYTTIKKKATVQVPINKTNVQKAQGILNKSPPAQKYKIVSRLGAGGYGTVFQATSNKGRNVAIKFQANSNNSKAEIHSLQKIRKYNITPKIYLHGTQQPWTQNFANLVPKGLTPNKKGSIIVTQLIKGKPLKNYMTGPPLNAALKQKIVNKVKKMHNAGIIHGDLHRNNIIINNKGEPWIIDFGKSLNLPAGKNANNYVKGFGHGSVNKYGKTFWYSNAAKTRSHQANGNFLKRLT
jgi:predicted Ser/Thr protein kinase